MDDVILVLATIVGLIPGAYFVFLVLRGAILSFRRSSDDDL